MHETDSSKLIGWWKIELTAVWFIEDIISQRLKHLRTIKRAMKNVEDFRKMSYIQFGWFVRLVQNGMVQLEGIDEFKNTKKWAVTVSNGNKMMILRSKVSFLNIGMVMLEDREKTFLPPRK